MPTIPPQPPTIINQNPIQYNQLVNNFLDNLEYNAKLAIKNMNLDQMDLLYNSVINIINNYVTLDNTYAVFDSNLLAIYRPCYIDLNIIGMIKVVGDIDMSNLQNLSSISSTYAEYFNAWFDFLEALQNSKYGF